MQARPQRLIASTTPEDRQYPLALPLRYRVYQGLKPVGSGEGRTVSISAKSAIFASRQPLERGLRIELLIDWPVLRDGAPLQFYMDGTVVLNNDGRVLVHASHSDVRVKPQVVKAAPVTAWACASSG
jgi:hypothetical protein